MKIKLERFKRKNLLKQMRYMCHEEAEKLATQQTRLLELSLLNSELFDASMALVKDMGKHTQSDSYTFGDDISVRLTKNDKTLLNDNKEVFIEIVELSTKLSLLNIIEDVATFTFK